MEVATPKEYPQALSDLQKKYQIECLKRLRPDGINQYTDLPAQTNRKGQTINKTPIQDPNLLQQNHHRVLIIGAGYGGLLFAVRFLQTSTFTAKDILIVDEAGGFGGTWYWNNYPGLTCDVESYIYMPLLEETGYMPSRKYVSGTELREHAERIARRWELDGRALFGVSVRSLVWDDEGCFWNVKVQVEDGSEQRLKADFVVGATGLLNSPKIPRGFQEDVFQGKVFHAARWDYQYTGGTSEDMDLVNLVDKKVGVVGTGATAVQVIPHLARCAKELVVFQRTPSSVARRDNHPTDPEWWSDNFRKQGPSWLKARRENFNAFISNETPLPAVNEVGDAWAGMRSFSVLIGGPANGDPECADKMQELDSHCQKAIHARVDSIVRDRSTAETLKPWYPGWCKRPCFSDEYLQAFNRPNVTLVDTLKWDKECQLTPNGIRASETNYDLDAIVLCTGYKLGSSIATGKMSVTGRDGITLQEKWILGIQTLHGVMTRDFPNLFFPGPFQAGASANQMYVLDQLARHVAYIVSEALKRVPRRRELYAPRVAIEPSVVGETGWVRETARWAGVFSGMANCTPSYFTFEGAFGAGQNWEIVSTYTTWGKGIKDFVGRIEQWRDRGDLEGIEICLC